MTKARLLQLIARQLNGEISPGEVGELNQWAAESPANRHLLDNFTNEDALNEELLQWRKIDPAEGHARWVTYRQGRRKSRIQRIIGWSVAASLLIAIGALIGLTRKKGQANPPSPAVAASAPVVSPGRNTAVLTLANGKKVLLDSAVTGELTQQGSAKLIKLDSGRLAYSLTAVKEQAVAYNVLATPRSGQYQLILPDGSHVWLNNASSLRYPTSFQGDKRTVELTGEAYFEIVKDRARPFIVKVNGEEVQVLGTAFNIMAYPDEGQTQTTLLTGEVQVKSGNVNARLLPGEQAQWDNEGSFKIRKNVPTGDIISWKNGFFYFGRASLKEVMRQLARWYDVEVQYEGRTPDLEFNGKIDRNLPLNNILTSLDKDHVHFRLEGRTIIVLPS